MTHNIDTWFVFSCFAPKSNRLFHKSYIRHGGLLCINEFRPQLQWNQQESTTRTAWVQHISMEIQTWYQRNLIITDCFGSHAVVIQRNFYSHSKPSQTAFIEWQTPWQSAGHEHKRLKHKWNNRRSSTLIGILYRMANEYDKNHQGMWMQDQALAVGTRGRVSLKESRSKSKEFIDIEN